MTSLRTRHLTLLFLLLFSPLFLPCSQADEYTFASIEFEPFGYVEDGAIKGIIPDIARAIADEANIQIEITLLPYSRVVNYIKNGNADFAIFSRNSDNDDEVDYISLLFIQNVILLTKKGNPLLSHEEIYDPDKVASIGYLRGTNFCPEILLDDRLSTFELKDFTQGLKMLNSNRISAFLTIDNTALYESKKLGLQSSFEFPGLSLKTIEAWLQVPKQGSTDNPLPIGKIRSATEKLTTEGKVDEILQQYLITN
ncbi:ABC-type amino acid transport/signal transduction systems periplasmic component/domain-like protein [Shewanella sediminis HAW-EB3]|uniref:ABC-type amino acid transport/signal transduction systems periplasmic component/domain-like protein n=1 Tax=Shewanella sediminis (strain HAW-EB3) TaxID=425104 RepID=A8FV43_SHESH|nr:transporter substrate-binding domain-containing protein [Shewanella sediminis]ABV36716.1 ABC-type amino acid transport/signal transduction systems periplasmic component/domain-like protein [Shewanella sediminis HAW-EB3]